MRPRRRAPGGGDALVEQTVGDRLGAEIAHGTALREFAAELAGAREHLVGRVALESECHEGGLGRVGHGRIVTAEPRPAGGV